MHHELPIPVNTLLSKAHTRAVNAMMPPGMAALAGNDAARVGGVAGGAPGELT